MSKAPDPYIHYRLHSQVPPATEPGIDGPAFVIGAGSSLVIRGYEMPGGVASVYRFPRLSEVISRASGPVHEIGTYLKRPVYCFAADLDEPVQGMEQIGYRELFGLVPDADLGLLGRAMQIVDWDATTRFCSRCGNVTRPRGTEPVKVCDSCGFSQYPRLAPAMIVGVIRDERLLLGQSPRFKGQFHSILAGFVEAGESVEECVHREVWEEVGIRVRDVTYFGSQPWPFPHSLMLGFTATYASGEISPNPEEIVHADWYAPDELPPVPSEVSISGRIIRSFVEKYGGAR